MSDELSPRTDKDIYKSRVASGLSDEDRRELVYNELVLVDKDVEIKSIESQCKSNFYRILNTIFSLIILACAAIIIALQAASECINIPVIVLSSVIFVAQGTHEIMRFGYQGVVFKQGTIRLRRIKRQIRDIMYMFHTYTIEQVIAMLSQLRTEYDEIDLGLYKISITDQAKFNTGFSTGHPPDPAPLPSFPAPFTNTASNDGSFNFDRKLSVDPHIHIHLETPSTPNSSPVVPKNPIEIMNDEIYEN